MSRRNGSADPSQAASVCMAMRARSSPARLSRDDAASSPPWRMAREIRDNTYWHVRYRLYASSPLYAASPLISTRCCRSNGYPSSLRGCTLCFAAMTDDRHRSIKHAVSYDDKFDWLRKSQHVAPPVDLAPTLGARRTSSPKACLYTTIYQ